MKSLGKVVCAAILVCAVGSTAHASKIRIGEEVALGPEMSLSFASAAKMGRRAAAEEGPVWSRTVHHPKAMYVAPHFSRFRLAEGDYLVVRSPDGSQSWRYTGLGRAGRGLEDGGFWSGHIKGDTAIVELFATTLDDGNAVEMDRYARGFSSREIREIGGVGGEDPLDPMAICGVDDSKEARCYLADEPEIYNRSIAVVRLLVGGTFACTGWLVGCEGHMMTNDHCISSQFDADNTDYEFMAEGATCETDCRYWGACPGVVEATSAPLIRASSSFDYAVVQLPQSLTDKYGFLQLREEGPEIGERIYIPQHPSQWGKRVAVESSHSSDGGFCEVQTLSAPSCSGGAPDVGYYCDTRGGSSGSPVLGYSDHRVVALHHCADCPNRGVNIVDVIDSLGSDLPACAFGNVAGTVTLNAETYSCDDVIEFTVEDDSLAGFGSQPVTIGSDTESAPETVLLTETTPGVFTGQIPTTDQSFSGNDGLLSLQHQDLITVEYVDADDGAGGTNVIVQAGATSDCRSPLITKLDVADITGSSATVSWDTDEDATSTVDYGATATDDDLVRKHRLNIKNLEECSTVTYGVSSADEVGNVGSDDNAGLFYEFTTGRSTGPTLDSADTPLTIPDFDGQGVSSTITVTDDAIAQDIDVIVDIEHAWLADLTVQLITPAGEYITLADRLGGGGQDYARTYFDDEATVSVLDGSPPFLGTYRPEEPLATGEGVSAAGDWQLRVVDSNWSDEGLLNDWTLILTYPHQVCGPHASYFSDAGTGDTCSSGDGDADGVWDAGERVEFTVALRNDGDEPLTGVSARVVPSDPAVTMIEDRADYGDIPLSAVTAIQSRTYVARLGADLGCADALWFDLEISSNEGSWSDRLTRVVGDPVELSTGELTENFDAGGIPAGWTVVDGSLDGHTWFADGMFDPQGCGNVDPKPTISGTWAAVDSDCAGAVDLDEQLISPSIDLQAADSVTLEFDHYFNHFENEIAEVDVRSPLTGGAWVNVARYSEDTPNSRTERLDLTPHAAGADGVQVRWRYSNANFDWFWYVDNVSVSAASIVTCGMTSCSAASASPAPIPDGSGGTQPVRVARDDPEGTRLSISYDDQCAPINANLIYGPLAGVATYAVSGSHCSLENPGTWDPAPEGDLWFLIVGANAAGAESSWGQSSAGERNGSGASGECLAVIKDLSETCP